MNQLLLIPSEEEALLLERSPRFRDCSEDERRFVVAWIQQAADHRQKPQEYALSARSVGDRAGIGHTKSAVLAKSERVLLALREAAQANSDLTDVMGSAALDSIVRLTLVKLQSGLWSPADVPPKIIDVLRECKGRLGLQPGVQGLVMSYTDAAGNRTEAAIGSSSQEDTGLADLMSQLRGPGARQSAPEFEGESAEVVRADESEFEADPGGGGGAKDGGESPAGECPDAEGGGDV